MYSHQNLFVHAETVGLMGTLPVRPVGLFNVLVSHIGFEPMVSDGKSDALDHLANATYACWTPFSVTYLTSSRRGIKVQRPDPLMRHASFATSVDTSICPVLHYGVNPFNYSHNRHDSVRRKHGRLSSV